MSSHIDASKIVHCLNPYLSLGLQQNPFVLENTWTIPRSLWIDRGYSQPPRPKCKQLVQIIGIKGAGKTSHLRHWQHKTGGPYCYYPPGIQRFKLPAVAPIAYWDEADRIPWPYRLSGLAIAACNGSTIVAGTHKNLQITARAVGLSIKTIQIEPFSAQLLIQWATERIKSVQIPNADCRLLLNMDKAQKIALAADGSWREAADLLHIWAAAQAQSSTSISQT